MRCEIGFRDVINNLHQYKSSANPSVLNVDRLVKISHPFISQ